MRRLTATRLASHFSFSNVVSVLALFIALSGGAYAAVKSIPGPDGVIHSCYQKKKGNLRVVKSTVKCSKAEKKLAFNQSGPTGPAGSQGVAGVQGIQGTPGVSSTRLFASVIGGSGALEYGSGVISTERTSVGNYKITFNQDVIQCIALANITTVSLPGIIQTRMQGLIGLVTVITSQADGLSDADRNFYIGIYC